MIIGTQTNFAKSKIIQPEYIVSYQLPDAILE